MSFANLYYKRAVGTPRACYICNKPTTTVLATINTVDFVYTCDAHLTDAGFASRVADGSDGPTTPPAKPSATPEEIAKVKEEYEERQKRKQEKAKDKNKEKTDDKDKSKEESKDNKKDAKKATSPPAASPSPAPTTPAPSHQKYTLHRDIFTLRLAEHRRRRQAAQAQALAPRLPGAPRSPLPSSSGPP